MILALATLSLSSLLVPDAVAGDRAPHDERREGGAAAPTGPTVKAEEDEPAPEAGGEEKKDAKGDDDSQKDNDSKAKSNLKLDPIGLVQLWGTAYDWDTDRQADSTGYGDPEDDPGVKVKRARLGVHAEWGGLDLGLVGGAGAGYDGFSDDEEDFSLYQASLGYGQTVGGCALRVDAGVMTMPFQADAMIGAGELTFQDRGMAAEHIGDDRGTGISGQAGSKGGGIKGTLGVYNSGFTPFGDDNTGKSFVFRVDGKVGDRDTNVLWDPAGKREGVGLGLGAAGLYTMDVATTTMGAAGNAVLRAGVFTAFGEGSFAQITPGATDVAAPEVSDPTMRIGVTGEANVAVGRWQPAARVSYFSDSSLGSWTQVLAGLVVHAGMKGDPDIVRVGAGYGLRLESDPIQNDTIRIWAQARI